MHISYLIKPASALCNMKCKYCFYADVASCRSDYSYGIMDKITMINLIEKTLIASNEVTYAFQGGEPTLAGLDFYLDFVQAVAHRADRQIIHYSIQTNGINLNDAWIDFFKEYNFLVGISLDGNKSNHNQVRFTADNNQTYDIVMSNIKKLKTKNINFSILTVITKKLAKHPKELYNFYKKNNLNFIQLIPCLPELDNNTENYYLTPALFSQFFQELFKLWYRDVLNGSQISISLFDQLLIIFKGLAPSMCGLLGECVLQYVIEANGNIYPCDFYCLDKYLLGNINFQNILQIKKNTTAKLFLEEPKKSCRLCKSCKFIKICNGNCKRMNTVYFDDKYCGYQTFLESTYQKFFRLAQKK